MNKHIEQGGVMAKQLRARYDKLSQKILKDEPPSELVRLFCGMMFLFGEADTIQGLMDKMFKAYEDRCRHCTQMKGVRPEQKGIGG